MDNRFAKIQTIIAECRYSVHDISRTETDGDPPLPRFNMPLELGVFIGARKFGGSKHSEKRALILDTTPYRYQKFISDIAGQDIEYHHGNVATAIIRTAGWLRNKSGRKTIPGGAAIAAEYQGFAASLPAILDGLVLTADEMTFSDFLSIVEAYTTEAQV